MKDRSRRVQDRKNCHQEIKEEEGKRDFEAE